MSISAEAVAVTSTATALNAASSFPVRLAMTTSADTYLGGSDVDSTDGFKITSAGGVVYATLLPGDVLYAVTATTATVKVLRT